MRLVAALFWYVEAGSSGEIALWAQQSAVVAAPAHPLLPLVLAVAAWGASKRGSCPALPNCATAHSPAWADQDPARRYAVFVLGDVALFEGRLDEAACCYTETARLAEAAGDRYTHAYAVVNTAFTARVPIRRCRGDRCGPIGAVCRGDGPQPAPHRVG